MRIPQPGDVLADKYHLEEVLGEGGFGVVLRATTELTGRPVAVKILKPKGGGYEMARAARFLREMATIAKLQSPQTLTLYDYGRTDDGVLFMVCEYVEGEDLLELMNRRGRLEEHEVVWILYQVLQSLAEAHELGVLHRDIKPSNIRIFEYEKDPLRVKVLDFGLAKAIEPGQQANLTATNKAIGTPRYMAPEQLTGQPLSPATDLYAVGLVAAEMLLGRGGDVLRDFRPGQRLQLSTADSVSGELARVVNGMLERDPAARYRGVRDVLADLRPLRRRGPLPDRGESVTDLPGSSSDLQTVPVTPPPRGPRVVLVDDRRDRPWLSWLAFFALSLATTAAAWMWSSDPPPQTPAPARSAPATALLRTPDPETPDASAPDDAAARVAARGHGEAPQMASRGCGIEPLRKGLDQVAKIGLMYVPEDYDPLHPHPVVYLLGTGDISEALMSRAERDGVILLSSWATPSPFTPKTDTHQALISIAREELCVDRSRIYVIGLDRGGGYTADELACDVEIAAIAVRDSLRIPHNKACAGGIPRLFIVGRDDQLYPRLARNACSGLIWEAQRSGWSDVDRAWFEANQCDPKSERPSLTRPDGKCIEWTCGAAYGRCDLEGGALQPSAAIYGNKKTCDRGKPGTFPWEEVAWDFLMKQPPRSVEYPPPKR